MPFVKLYKNKAYFKRFQTKYKRRREGKTDYKARTAMVKQSKNKYNSPKYRFVVRISNKKVVCQIIYSEIIGDKVICHADSSELSNHGVKVGFKNYAACYSTGLLCARRLLTKYGLAEKYTGIGDDEANGEINTTEVDGKKFFVSEVDDDKNPFRAALDVGIQRVTLGNRVMGCVKGAVDGGLDIPHSEKKFPGYDADAKTFDASVHSERIYAQHISDYMEELDEEEVAKLFSDYVAEGVEADDVREMWEEAHKSIRSNPAPAAKKSFDASKLKKFKRDVKHTYEVRKANREAKKQAMYDAKAAAKAEAEASSEEEEDDEEDE